MNGARLIDEVARFSLTLWRFSMDRGTFSPNLATFASDSPKSDADGAILNGHVRRDRL